MVRGEARILLSQKPIQEMEKTNRKWGEKFRFIEEVLLFAQKELKLKRTIQYRTYADLKDDFTIKILVVAEKDQIQIQEWHFPVVGSFPYIGFFEEKWLNRFIDQYPDKDIYVRDALAFSTLGLLPDPILPSFLHLSLPTLARTLIHELVHATIFIPGEVEWSETVASAMGDAGAALFFQKKGDLSNYQKVVDAFYDEIMWGKLIEDTIRDLTSFYKNTTSPEERVKFKEERISRLKEEIQNTPFRNPGYKRYGEYPINHAFLLAHRTYSRNPEVQENWFQSALRNYPATLSRLKEWAGKKDPRYEKILF